MYQFSYLYNNVNLQNNNKKCKGMYMNTQNLKYQLQYLQTISSGENIKVKGLNK
jgi:Protein of unknown function (DUF1239).